MDPAHNIKAVSPHCLSVAGDGFYYSTSLHKLQYKEEACWPKLIVLFSLSHSKPLKKLSKEMSENTVSQVIHSLSIWSGS